MSDKDDAYDAARESFLTMLETLPAASVVRPKSILIRNPLANVARQLGLDDAADCLYAQILEVAPKNQTALTGHIETALAMGQAEEALNRASRFCELFPADRKALQRRGEIAAKLDRHSDVIDAFTPLADSGNASLAVLKALGHAQLKAGLPEKALRTLKHVVAAEPEDRQALHDHVTAALAANFLEEALESAEFGITRFPRNQHLLCRLADTLKRLHRPDEAIARLAPIEANGSASFQLSATLAQLHTACGDSKAAQIVLRRALALDPGREAGWVMLAELKLAESDDAGAQEVVASALEHLPGGLALRRLRARLTYRAGKHSDAVAMLRDIVQDDPEDPANRLALASMLMATGAHAEADRCYQKVLTERPCLRQALMGRINAAEAMGDLAKAIAMIDCLPDTKNGPHSDDANLLSRYIDLALRSGDRERLALATPKLIAKLPALGDQQLARLLRIAPNVGHPTLAANVISEVARRKRVSKNLAFAVLSWAVVQGSKAEVELVRLGLERRLLADQSLAFRLQAIRMLHGPDVAYSEGRRSIRYAPDPETAAELAMSATQSGRSHLAIRYLRFCARRWPSAHRLRQATLSAYVTAGALPEAENYLKALAQHRPAEEVARMQLPLLIHSGDLSGALALMDHLAALDARHNNMMERLRICLFSGDAEGALEAVARAEAVDRAHFRPSHLGALLNELEVYQRLTEAGGIPLRDAAAAFFDPARRVVANWMAKREESVCDVAGHPVKKPKQQIFQYWDQSETPPSLDAVMASWRKLPGWSYRRFDRREAIDWLGKNYDSDHVRAFKMATNPAQEADFMRLCLLEAEGGLYVDADDKRLTTPEALLAGTIGTVLFVEPYGALSNNVIYAPQASSVIAIARRLALAALLGRENDMTWSKTGPGLVTRAAAIFILDHGEAAAGALTILPQVHMRRHLHPHIAIPHKFTSSYWNSSRSTVPEPIRRALTLFTAEASS